MSEKLNNKQKETLSEEDIKNLNDFYTAQIKILNLQKEYHQLKFDVKKLKYEEILLDVQFNMKHESTKERTKDSTEQK